MALSDEQLQALKAKHGRIETATFNGNDIAFRVPSRLDCQMYAAAEGQPDRDEQLARLIVVVPEAEAFGALLADYPFMVQNKKVGGALLRAMGIYEADQGKG